MAKQHESSGDYSWNELEKDIMNHVEGGFDRPPGLGYDSYVGDQENSNLGSRNPSSHEFLPQFGLGVVFPCNFQSKDMNNEDQAEGNRSNNKHRLNLQSPSFDLKLQNDDKNKPVETIPLEKAILPETKEENFQEIQKERHEETTQKQQEEKESIKEENIIKKSHPYEKIKSKRELEEERKRKQLEQLREKQDNKETKQYKEHIDPNIPPGKNSSPKIPSTGDIQPQVQVESKNLTVQTNNQSEKKQSQVQKKKILNEEKNQRNWKRENGKEEFREIKQKEEFVPKKKEITSLSGENQNTKKTTSGNFQGSPDKTVNKSNNQLKQDFQTKSNKPLEKLKQTKFIPLQHEVSDKSDISQVFEKENFEEAIQDAAMEEIKEQTENKQPVEVNIQDDKKEDAENASDEALDKEAEERLKEEKDKKKKKKNKKKKNKEKNTAESQNSIGIKGEDLANTAHTQVKEEIKQEKIEKIENIIVDKEMNSNKTTPKKEIQSSEKKIIENNKSIIKEKEDKTVGELLSEESIDNDKKDSLEEEEKKDESQNKIGENKAKSKALKNKKKKAAKKRNKNASKVLDDKEEEKFEPIKKKGANLEQLNKSEFMIDNIRNIVVVEEKMIRENVQKIELNYEFNFGDVCFFPNHGFYEFLISQMKVL